ncbi:MAG: D-amino-acid transaminase [Eubacteriales bacterium]
MAELAWVDGKITSQEEAKVPYLDHGTFFGYGVYEALKVYNGQLFAVEDHLDRLDNSLQGINIKQVYSRDELISIMNDLIIKSELKDAVLYLQITRGIAPRKHSLEEEIKPFLTLFISYLPPIPEKLRIAGVKAILLPDDRWAHPNIKTLNLLPNVIAKQKADSEGAFEAILVKDNIVTEASSSNVFAVFGNKIVTHPTDGKILPGISRLVVLSLAKKYNMELSEKYITQEQLLSADEVFLTNTGAEVIGITDIDGTKIGKGVPGPITKNLYKLFLDVIEEYFKE